LRYRLLYPCGSLQARAKPPSSMSIVCVYLSTRDDQHAYFRPIVFNLQLPEERGKKIR
jgi:hypothetical protein